MEHFLENTLAQGLLRRTEYPDFSLGQNHQAITKLGGQVKIMGNTEYRPILVAGQSA
jgi:hypothetical protein